MASPSELPPRSWLWRCVEIGTKSFRPSPRIEQYLALICGIVIIVITSRVWYALQIITMDGGLWRGPDDPYLLQFHSATAWLWLNDPYGIALAAWGLVGLVALGPCGPDSWRSYRWPTVVWGIAALVFCFTYVVLGFQLLLLPLGIFS